MVHMNNKTDEVTPLITPGVLAWIVTLIAGVIIPLFTQQLVADSIRTLDETPVYSSLILTLMLFGNFLAASANVYYIALTKKFHTVLALTITLFSPIYIWLLLPYILG